MSLFGTQLNKYNATVCNAHKVPTERPSMESTFRIQTTEPPMPPNVQPAAQHTKELLVPQNACSYLSPSHNGKLPVTQNPATPQVHLSAADTRATNPFLISKNTDQHRQNNNSVLPPTFKTPLLPTDNQLTCTTEYEIPNQPLVYNNTETSTDSSLKSRGRPAAGC
ncbi:hypothetical protein DPMN_098646 [Dreissena polymorpha]|uniref:Uncharacterized protein n=1 Tax=Dreissena polymorpha TaxID=45954 RepID=A0A9D4R5P2_DREPO|nr:hypothetical protein DPMN_098646 [Dreissena polymorpha]